MSAFPRFRNAFSPGFCFFKFGATSRPSEASVNCEGSRADAKDNGTSPFPPPPPPVPSFSPPPSSFSSATSFSSRFSLSLGVSPFSSTTAGVVIDVVDGGVVVAVVIVMAALSNEADDEVTSRNGCIAVVVVIVVIAVVVSVGVFPASGDPRRGGVGAVLVRQVSPETQDRI